MNADATTLDEAAGRRWDVVVIGAGPAGTMAAIETARLGASVLVLDRAAFPRAKVCGCCLGAAALDTLRGAGLGDVPARCGAQPLEHLDLRAGSRRVRLRIPSGAVISRRALDTALLDNAIGAGARFIDRCAAVAGPCRGEARIVRARRDATHVDVSARVVILAAGLRARTSPPAAGTSRIGVATTLETRAPTIAAGVVGMACGEAGYVGWVRLEDDRVRVAAALDPDAVRRSRGVTGAVRRVLAACGHEGLHDLGGTRWRGTPPLTGPGAIIGAERLLVIGDAAGYVEPFTGEGIGWALASGRAVAPIAVAAATEPAWRETWSNAWRRSHRRMLGPRHRACTFVARTLRRPPLTRAAVAAAALLPGVAERLVAAFCAPPGALENGP
ncbi:MAG: NAD(P)/FAD-dependent oxidoreductase [Planctomycetes bacterium]|nr:NAD(P)/FAD-dependent oxidoreductase [Planctomycetota bacterium]